MMTRRGWLAGCFALVFGLTAGTRVHAQEDPGREVIAMVTLTVLYGTDGDPALAGKRVTRLTDTVIKRLKSEKQLQFKSYRKLGADTQPLFRSYENWAQPLPPSDEILLRFEAQGRPLKDRLLIDLELWLSRKKIIKTDALLGDNKPLYVLGPAWRGGRLILAVELAPVTKPRS